MGPGGEHLTRWTENTCVDIVDSRLFHMRTLPSGVRATDLKQIHHEQAELIFAIEYDGSTSFGQVLVR